MPERVLTLRELNRTTLARQLLLRRSRLSVVAAVERVAGLQAQDVRSPYVALCARLEPFDRAKLDRAVRRSRVVKGTLMRVTLHLVSARDHRAFATALTHAWQARAARAGKLPGGAATALEALAAKARVRPLARAEVFDVLKRELGAEAPATIRELAELGALTRLRHTPECALWEFRRGVRYVPSDADRDAEAALAHLVRRYLAAFGPASPADLAQWSGLPQAALRPVVERLRPTRYRDESGRELLDWPRGRIERADLSAPPRLLPAFEEALLAYDRRERILPEEYRRVVIRGGLVDPTFTVDGFVAGRWRLERGRVVLEPFAPLPRRAQRDLEDEAQRLQALVA